MSEKHPPENGMLYEGTLGEVVAQLVAEFKQTREMIEDIRDTVNLDKEALIRETELRVLAEADGDIAVLRRNVQGGEKDGDKAAGNRVPVT